MKRLVKVALGFTTLATFGNAYAEDVTNTVTVLADVASACNLQAFSGTVNLSGQIDLDGGTATPPGYDQAMPIDAVEIFCTTPPTWTTLKMTSANQGVKSGENILRYDVNGTFGKNNTQNAIIIDQFNSMFGPFTDLLGGDGVTPLGLPALNILLTTGQTAVAGNYTDTLNIIISIGS